MKLDFFGIKFYIPKQYIVLGCIIFLLASSIWGWYLCRNNTSIIEPKKIISEKANEIEEKVEELTNISKDKDDDTGKSSNYKININTAGLSELKTLYGIGTRKAIAIIEYREGIGVFKNIEEIQKVRGIGSKIFERIKDHICVD